VAVAVAFFILFASMSAGLQDFIDDELGRSRPVHIFLEPGSPNPFDEMELGLIEGVVATSLARTSTPGWVTPRVELPVSSILGDEPVRLWGVDMVEGTDLATPPYNTNAVLGSGRHLVTDDAGSTGDAIPAVMGASAKEALFPRRALDDVVSIGPDGSVDPWWMASASDYPVDGTEQVTVLARGPVDARLVGVLEPGQGPDLDWGIFVPIEPLLSKLGQTTTVGSSTVYYPQIVVTVGDGSSVDVEALEANIVLQVPGIEGTDDAWDRSSFEDVYGGTSEAIDGWLLVVTLILVIMLVAGVSDTTLVAVADRRREIATLRAVGVHRGQVQRLILTEVVSLAAIGLAAGTMAGILLSLLFGHFHETTGGQGVFLAPVTLDPLVLMGAVTLALGTAVLAAAYPAMRAAGEPPTEALRYE
jgi:hypothetical protein